MLAILYRVMGYIAAFCMVAMMALTVIDATGRYFFSAPLPGTIEYISYLLAITIMAGYPLVTRDKGHISVGVIAELFRGRLARFEHVVTALATFAASGFVVWFLIMQALSYQRTNRMGDVIHLPLAWLAFALATLACAASLFAAVFLWDAIRSGRHSAQEKSST